MSIPQSSHSDPTNVPFTGPYAVIEYFVLKNKFHVTIYDHTHTTRFSSGSYAIAEWCIGQHLEMPANIQVKFVV